MLIRLLLYQAPVRLASSWKRAQNHFILSPLSLIPYMLNPNFFMHLLCSSTNSLHFQPSPSDSVPGCNPSCPYSKKQSSLLILVSGQAQHGLIPVGLRAVTCLLEVSGARGVAEGAADVAGGDAEDDEDDEEHELLVARWAQ